MIEEAKRIVEETEIASLTFVGAGAVLAAHVWWLAKDPSPEPTATLVGALVGFVAAAGALVWKGRRASKLLRQRAEIDAMAKDLEGRQSGLLADGSKVFHLDSPASRLSFYKELAQSVRDAETVVYRSGPGYGAHDPIGRQCLNLMIEAEESALKRGVRLRRLQTGSHAYSDWVREYARLMDSDSTREQLELYRANDRDASFTNVAVIDPLGKRPVVQILFETIGMGAAGRKERTTLFAMFLYGQHGLASAVRQGFQHRFQESGRQMTAPEVRALAATQRYFAYGSNLSEEHLLERCPSAEFEGRGALSGWHLSFDVEAPDGRLSASISPHPEDEVEGVVWTLTPEDLARLDEMERGPYTRSRVRIMDSARKEEWECWTYVRAERYPGPSGQAHIDQAYMEVMRQAADRFGLARTAAIVAATRSRTQLGAEDEPAVPVERTL